MGILTYEWDDQIAGKCFAGSSAAILDDGTPVHIKDVLCFAEKVHNRY